MSRELRAATFGWALSLALHGAIASYIFYATTTPDLGFEFALPDEVEFGLTDAVTVTEGASAPTPEASAAAAEAGEGEGEPSAPDAGVPRDAGQDAGPPRIAAAEPEEAEGASDEGEGEGDQPGEGTGVAFLPAGSQLALRLDVTRIRESPLADDVRRLLAALPDWQQVLGGSGIDPLEDLDRLLVATPNLDRSRMILAGRSVSDDAPIRAAAEALAVAAGETLTWRRAQGVPVTDWHDPAPTERVIAIVGPRHFVIARPEDLPRVLAVARNRAADRAAEGEDAEHPADALLSMGEGEGLSLEIEGARNFSRRPTEMLPTRARFAMTQLPDEGGVAVRSRWTYEDADQAESAEAYWNRMREGYARNIIARSLGVGGLLGRATLEVEEEHLDGAVDLSVAELSRLIGLGAMFMGGARTDSAAPTPLPGAPPSPGATPPAPAPPPGPRPPPSPFE